MSNFFGVAVFHTSMVNWRKGGYMFPRYICIWQYFKHIWCSGVPNISGQLEGVYLPLVYVHSAIS